MKNPFQKFVGLSMGAGFLALSAMAEAGSVTVVSVSPDAGSVVVVRGAETFSLSPGDELLNGDVIVTRSSGSVSIASGDACTRDLSGLQSITIGPDICVQQIESLEQTASSEVQAPTGTSDAVAVASSSTQVMTVLGGVALAGAVAAAAGSGGGSDQPSSP